MSKDKRKRKFFQGMEHLREQAVANNQPVISQNGNQPANAGTSIETTYIKKDLVGVGILMGIIILILVGMAVLDKKTDKLTVFAEKVTSFVIK